MNPFCLVCMEPTGSHAQIILMMFLLTREIKQKTVIIQYCRIWVKQKIEKKQEETQWKSIRTKFGVKLSKAM